MAYVIGDDCIACGTCQGECPVEAISEGEKYSIDPDLCTECGVFVLLRLSACLNYQVDAKTARGALSGAPLALCLCRKVQIIEYYA